ncbi:MAG TPA: hypothetical protein VGG35_07395 [Streptosporangiaceae bacterium]|jgi:hypothetical protein
MKFFERKSNWDRVRDTALATMTEGSARQAGKVALTAAGGAVAVTIASAAVSSIRHGSQS